MYGYEKEKHLGGWWSAKVPWGDPGTWGPEIWNKIIKDYDIESVVDMGCGLGASTAYFAKKGLYTVGIEGGSNAINNSLFEGYLIKNDYTVSSALEDEEFDLIWCCEFVQHVEEKFIDNFLHDFKHAKYIAMTYDGTESPHYRVNVKSAEYWIEKLNSIGFKCGDEYSKQLRKIAIAMRDFQGFSHSGHLINLLFFEKAKNS